jgi:predicted neuraminidase
MKIWKLLAPLFLATAVSAAPGLYGSWNQAQLPLEAPPGGHIPGAKLMASPRILQVRALPGTDARQEDSPHAGVSASGETRGLEVLVPARRSAQVLDLWVGMVGGTALIEASVTGGGAHYFADKSLNSPSALQVRQYRFNFAASKDSQTLRVSVRSMIAAKGATPKITIFGAALSSSAGNRPPSVKITKPAAYSRFQAPEEIIVEAAASDPDGRIAKVVYYDFSSAIKLGESSEPPYRIKVARSTSWSGAFCARAYDNLGHAVDSQPIRYQVLDRTLPKAPVTPPKSAGFISKGLPGAGFEGVSSMTELPGGDLMAIWYGGKYELSPDTAVYASTLRKGASEWSVPRVLLGEPNVSYGNAVLLWKDGSLWCFYVKVFGDAWEYARLFYRISRDRGMTWGKETAISQPDAPYPTGTLVATTPLVLRNGDILLPLNREAYDPDNRKQWYSLFLISSDNGKTWKETEPLYTAPGNIQPSVVQLSSGELLAFFRVRGQNRTLWRSRSKDNGRTWAPLESTDIPNPSARVGLGILPGDKLVLAYNHSKTSRTPLHLALSEDGGTTWKTKPIESGGYSYTYPYLFVGADNSIHVSYNDNYYAVKYARVDLDWFLTSAGSQ